MIRCLELGSQVVSRTYVFVIDQLHQFEFSVGSLGVGHVLEGPAQLLDGHVLLAHRVVGSAENKTQASVRTS